MNKGDNYTNVSMYLESRGLLSSLKIPLESLKSQDHFIVFNFAFMTTNYQQFRTLPYAQTFQELITSYVWYPSNYSQILRSSGTKYSWESNMKVKSLLDKMTKKYGDFMPADKQATSLSFVQELLNQYPQLRRKEFWRNIDTVELVDELDSSAYFSDKLTKELLGPGESFKESKQFLHTEKRMPLDSTAHIKSIKSLSVFTHEMGHSLYELHFKGGR